MGTKRLMTIKLSRELFAEIDGAANFLSVPNRTKIIEGLLYYAINHDAKIAIYDKAVAGLRESSRGNTPGDTNK